MLKAEIVKPEMNLETAIDEPQKNTETASNSFVFLVLLSVKILSSCANFFPAARSGVAQICNLLYRRIAFGGTSYFPESRCFRPVQFVLIGVIRVKEIFV